MYHINLRKFIPKLYFKSNAMIEKLKIDYYNANTQHNITYINSNDNNKYKNNLLKDFGYLSKLQYQEARENALKKLAGFIINLNKNIVMLLYL